MTTQSEIYEVDATQPDDDGVVNGIIINYPGEAAIRLCDDPSGPTISGGAYTFNDLRISLPELGDDLRGGLVVDLAWTSALASLFRVVEPNEIRVRWFQATKKNVDAGGDNWALGELEARVDTTEVSRTRIVLSCVARRPLDVRAGRYYDLENFPSVESFGTAGKFQFPPPSEA